MEADDPFTWRRFGVALTVVLTVIIAFWALSPPRYLTNDDVAIRLGVEGAAVPGQPPTGFVLLTHAALGWALASLHDVLPRVPLWDLINAAVLACGLAAFFTLAWSALGPGYLARLTSLAAMLAAAAPLVVGMQFTIGAVLAGGAAVGLALTEYLSTAPRRLVLVMSTLLLLGALLVRPMGGAAGAITVGLLLTPWIVWRARAGGIRLLDVAGVVAVAVALCGALLSLDGLLYRVSSEWEEHYEYNWMEAQLVEWGGELPPSETRAIRAAVGWSGNDWAMLQRWFGVDPELHGYAQVRKAYEARPALMNWNDRLDGFADRLAIVSPGTLQQLAIDSVQLLAVIAALVAVFAGIRGGTAVACVLLLFLGLCVAIEAAFKELPFRLLAPLQGCALAAVLITVGTRRRTASPQLSIVGLAVILAVLTQQARTIAATTGSDRRHTAQVEEDVSALQELSPSLIVIHADAFPATHWWRPFVQPTVELPAISLAGHNQNPQLQHFLSATGRQPLFRAVCDDPSILVISEPGRLDLVTTYLREHFNAAVRWDAVFTGSFRAWRCVPETPPAASSGLDATMPAIRPR